MRGYDCTRESLAKLAEKKRKKDKLKYPVCKHCNVRHPTNQHTITWSEISRKMTDEYLRTKR